MRVDVEFRHAGQAVHKEHAALPQQQASWAAENKPKTAPMLTVYQTGSCVVYPQVTFNDLKTKIDKLKEAGAHSESPAATEGIPERKPFVD